MQEGGQGPSPPRHARALAGAAGGREGIQAAQQRPGDTWGAQASLHSGEVKAKAPANAKTDLSPWIPGLPSPTACHLQHSVGPWPCEPDHPTMSLIRSPVGFFSLLDSCIGLTGGTRPRLRSLGSTVRTGKHWCQTTLSGPTESPWVSPALRWGAVLAPGPDQAPGSCSRTPHGARACAVGRVAPGQPPVEAWPGDVGREGAQKSRGPGCGLRLVT